MSKHPFTDSSGDQRHPSRWSGWALGLLAVPALYVLTAPPLVWGFDTRWGTVKHVGVPDWMDRYLLPYRWIHNSEMMKPILEPYSLWWRFYFLGRVQNGLKASGGSLFISG